MTPIELRGMCTDAIQTSGEDARLVLIVGQRARPGRRVRIGKYGPIGDVVAVGTHGTVTAMFRAAAVRAWVDRVMAEATPAAPQGAEGEG